MSFTQFKTLILLFPLIFSLDYSAQTGSTWGDDCQTGKIQSPINIQTSEVEKDNSKFSFKSIDYTTIQSTSITYQHEYSISTPSLDNGDITVVINGTEFKYKILNIHFHLKSEHTIDDNLYKMEMHVVHENTNASDKNNLHMVIGYLFESGDDYEDNSFLESIGFNTGETVKNVNVKDIVKQEAIYYYKGSLTTPPCTEDVNWVVVKDIKKMSKSQYDKFADYVTKLNANYKDGNNRDPLDLNGRKVYLSDGSNNYIKLSYSFLLLFFILF